MDIYNSIIKQSNIIFFIMDEDGIIVDTNLYTMELVNMYDLNGRELAAILDECSEQRFKNCISCNVFNNIEVNLLSEKGLILHANLSLNRIDNYITILGILQKDKNPAVIDEGYEVIKYIGTDREPANEDNKRKWQVDNIDPLTGLYNREFFNHLFEAKYSSAVHEGGNIGVICFKINELDNIISKHGNEKGDRTLAGFAQVMLTNTRSTDYCIRHEDKFLLLLTNTNMDIMQKIADRIKKSAADNMSISLSAGWACTVDKQLNDKWDLIKLAYDNVEKL